MTSRPPSLPPARVHQCADGARPVLRRMLSQLRRCTGPVGLIVLVVLCTMLLYGVSAWQMSGAIAVREIAGG